MGWSEHAPKKGKQREQLAKSCGKKCFLLRNQKKFPVCPRCNGNVCTCKPSCEGLRAARIRAAQWHYKQVKETAEKLLKESGCSGRQGRDSRKKTPSRKKRVQKN